MREILDKGKQNKIPFTPHKSDISYYSIECAEYDALVNKLEEMEQKYEVGVKPIKRDMGKISIFSKIFGYTQYYTCPHCRNCLLTKNANERQLNNNCWDCGGSIDWSDEE